MIMFTFVYSQFLTTVDLNVHNALKEDLMMQGDKHNANYAQKTFTK